MLSGLTQEHLKFAQGQDDLKRGQLKLSRQFGLLVDALCSGGGDIRGFKTDGSANERDENYFKGGVLTSDVAASSEDRQPFNGSGSSGCGLSVVTDGDPFKDEGVHRGLDSTKSTSTISETGFEHDAYNLSEPPAPSQIEAKEELEHWEDDSEDEGKFVAMNKFLLVDKDGSGGLDLDEMLKGGKILGLTQEEARDLYNDLEKDSNGHVTVQAYMASYRTRKVLSQLNQDQMGAGFSLTPIMRTRSDMMINPRSNFRFVWDLGVMMPFLVYLAILLPFRLTFVNEAPLFTVLYWVELMIDMLFLVDMGFNFRTGILVESQNIKGERYEAVEYDRRSVANQYVKSWFFIDFFSGVPFSLIDLISNGGAPNNAKSLKALRFLKLARLLKLGRLLKIEKILKSLSRDSLDLIQDFFTEGASLSINKLMSLLVALAFVIHLMACGFVAVGKATDTAGQESWLNYELNGPFTSKDTTGARGNDPVYSIYIASFYFCLTTMTSVGYGDILPRNNNERLFVVFLEFASSIVFATVIGLITAVVTSLDLGAKKKAEGLAEVSAFVSFRRFPKKLGRRVRRHFRNFYSVKTATDEKKIFNTLSTQLRKDVSEFLVLELMGSESFFMTMSTTLWPRLLPLLQPMTFEANEKLCNQGEECEEMYVIITGVLTGKSHLNGEIHPRVQRRLVKGDSVNVLCLIEIWFQCVETVVSGLNTVETYAVRSEEFVSLFKSNMDIKNFTSMQKREIQKFKFAPFADAPTSLGMPLFFSCFSSVELKLVKVVGSILGIGKSLGWIVVDLVDTNTGKPLNDFWSYTSQKTSLQENNDGSLELFCGADVRWTDLPFSLDVASVRYRIFVSDPRNGAAAHLAGTSGVSLKYLQQQMPTSPGTSTPNCETPPHLETTGGTTGEITRTALYQRFSSPSLGDQWEIDNPLEVGEVSVWCGFKAARPTRRPSMTSSLGSSDPIKSFDCTISALRGTEVLLGEEWVGPPSSSAVKFRTRVKGPEKSKRRRASSIIEAPRPSMVSAVPSIDNEAFLGTKAGQNVLSRQMTNLSVSTII